MTEAEYRTLRRPAKVWAWMGSQYRLVDVRLRQGGFLTIGYHDAAGQWISRRTHYTHCDLRPQAKTNTPPERQPPP